MGCDIHAFVEYESSEVGRFWAVTQGSFCLPRNYDVFGAFAGVRTPDIPALFLPRGLPKGITQETFEEYFQFVIDRKQIEAFRGWDYVLREEIETELREGRVTIVGCDQKPSGITSELGYIRNPDWHTSSWLFLDEIHAALEHAKIDVEQLSPEYRVLLDLMASLERHFGSRKSRLVFWFDN